MKRNNVFRIFAVAAVLMVIGVNQFFAQDKNYTYRDELMNDLLVTRTVYKNSDEKGAVLTLCVKKEYTYDVFDRIKTQCISRWNSIENRWDREAVYIYNYDDSTYSVELSRYKTGNDRVVSKRERCVYRIDNDRNILLSKNYEWNKKEKSWVLKSETQLNDSIPLLGLISTP